MKAYYMIIAISSVMALDCRDNDTSIVIGDGKDKSFLIKAGPYSQAEVEYGKIAAARGISDAVKKYGLLMVTEHEKVVNDLKAIAARADIGLPTSLNNIHQQKLSEMKNLTGYAFDTAYIHNQVNCHRKEKALYQSEASEGTVAVVMNYAAGYLPSIELNLAAVDSIAATLKP